MYVACIYSFPVYPVYARYGAALFFRGRRLTEWLKAWILLRGITKVFCLVYASDSQMRLCLVQGEEEWPRRAEMPAYCNMQYTWTEGYWSRGTAMQEAAKLYLVRFGRQAKEDLT